MPHHLQDLSFEPEIRRLVSEAGSRLAELDAAGATGWNAQSLPAWDEYRRAVDAAHSCIDQAILDASQGITHRDEVERGSSMWKDAVNIRFDVDKTKASEALRHLKDTGGQGIDGGPIGD